MGLFKGVAESISIDIQHFMEGEVKHIEISKHFPQPLEFNFS